MPELDKELQAAVKAAKGGRPMQFAFVPKGTEGKLVVAKKVSSKQAADLKKEVGGTALFRGRLLGEDGVLVFELAKEPPATLKAQLKKRLKVDAGLTLEVEVRLKADAEAEAPEDEADEGTPPVPPPQPTAPTDDPAAATFARRVQELTEPVKQAAASQTPAGQEAKLRFSEAGMLARKQDFAQANALLDRVAELVKGAGPQTPPGTPPPDGDPAAEWKSRLAEWTPAIKEAVAAKGPAAGEIAKLLAQATALSKPGGDMPLALEKLKECHELAKGSGKPPTPPPSDGTAKPKAPPPPTDPGAVQKRFNDLAAALKTALAAKGPEVARIQTLATAVSGLLKNKDYAQAGKVLDELEPLLGVKKPQATPPKVPPPPKGPPPPRPGGPEVGAESEGTEDEDEGVPKAGLAAWQTAREQVVKQVRAAAAKIEATGDPDAKGAVIELLSIVKNLTPTPASPQQVAELDRYLKTDDVVSAAEECPPDYGTLRIREPLLAALEQLKAPAK